jgi:PhnB protein
MATKVKPVPEGMHTVTPHLVVRDAAKAIEWYKKAFGAEEQYRMPMPNGKIMHAQIRIGDSVILMAEELAEMGNKSPQSIGGSATTLNIYVDDAEKLWKRAVDAGAKVTMPLSEQFWGDKYGVVVDPFGHIWAIGQHVRDMTPEEMAQAGQKAFSQMPQR